MGECVQAGQILCAGGGDPVFEVLAGACGEDLGEGADVPIPSAQRLSR
jgi:hypothetical protein